MRVMSGGAISCVAPCLGHVRASRGDLTKFGVEQLRRGVRDIANRNAVHARDLRHMIGDDFLGKKWIRDQQPLARSRGVVRAWRLVQRCEAMISWTK